MLGKNGNFRGKSFEKFFSQEIPMKIPRNLIFRGKIVKNNWPQW
jgi:hypothetical protein